jgi:gas vesicle protein
MRRRHEDPEVIILEEEGTSPLVWLLLGAALGAGVALLLAPASGEETRRRLAEGARRLRDRTADTVDDLRQRFEDLRDEVVETVSEVRQAVRGEGGGEGDEPATAERRRGAGAQSARAELERRLAAARARRRAAAAEGEEPVA